MNAALILRLLMALLPLLAEAIAKASDLIDADGNTDQAETHAVAALHTVTKAPAA